MKPPAVVSGQNGTPPPSPKPTGWRTPRDPVQEAARLEAIACRRRELVVNYLALSEVLLADFGRQAASLPLEVQAGALRLVLQLRRRRDKFREVGPRV